MSYRTHFTAGLPHLDIHTLSEDWALATALEGHWIVQAKSIGLKPSDWIDSQGDRMYGAVIWLSTEFDLENPLEEDEQFDAVTEFVAIRKPHALSVTKYIVDGKTKAEVRLLSSFIKRTTRGSNKKFAKVRDIWTAEDVNGEAIDDLLNQHHARKSDPNNGEVVSEYEVNRIQDFNTADFLYFKNYVRIAKAAEWKYHRSKSITLNRYRQCFYYGNVDDGETITSKIAAEGDKLYTHHFDPTGRRIFISDALVQPVEIMIR